MRDGHDPGTEELFGPQPDAWGYLRPWASDPDMAAQTKLLKREHCRRFVSVARLPGDLKGLGRIAALDVPGALSVGDTLIVERLALLATSLTELLSVLRGLRDRRIRLVAVREGIDSVTPAGGFLLSAVAHLVACDAHWNTDRRSQRTGAREARGRLGGRPEAISDADLAKIRKWIGAKPKERTPGLAAVEFNVPRSTLYRRLSRQTPV